MKHKICLDNIPDKYKPLLKEEMTNDELSVFGTILMKDKLANLKLKILRWFDKRKNKKNNRKKI